MIDDQIKAAVGAHSLWKGRLRAAIDDGKTDLTVGGVRDDHQCTFGKWLHGPDLEAAAKQSKHYRECVELHRSFHQAAAAILALALAGKKQEAHTALEPGHDFDKISLNLTKAMMAWKDDKVHV